MSNRREYDVVLKKSAAKTLAVIPRRDQLRIAKAIDGLRRDPRPSGVEKLAGMDHVMRIRGGDYRVLYTIEDAVLRVLVIRIGHRKDVYHFTT